MWNRIIDCIIVIEVFHNSYDDFEVFRPYYSRDQLVSRLEGVLGCSPRVLISYMLVYVCQVLNIIYINNLAIYLCNCVI